jgi:hypothetical protein
MDSETKQDVLADIAALIGAPIRQVSRGSTEPKEAFVDVVRALNLPISTEARKPELGAAIVRFAGLTWDENCDSRATPSGGGDTVTLEGLQRIRAAVVALQSATQRELTSVAEDDDPESLEHGVVDEIRLRDALVDRYISVRPDAFSDRVAAEHQRLLFASAIQGHADLITRLIGAFESAGGTCKEDPSSVDLLVRFESRATLVVEAKTLAGEIVQRSRLGVSQLYEYTYRMRSQTEPPVVLILAFDRPPTGPDWLIPYLTEDRAINLMWPGADSFYVVGPDSALLRRLVPSLTYPGRS